MASIDKRTRTLFFVTSPRTPANMIPEIQVLVDNLAGKEWNDKSQIRFMELLDEAVYGVPQVRKDPAFSARDRVNRAPKALGFVDLNPVALTPAGQAWVSGELQGEALLRQLLKFQLPSPFHTPLATDPERFWVKPYLEILRLIHHFGSLTFDEVMIFGMQLTDYRQFDAVVAKIDDFRIEKARRKGEYKKFIAEVKEVQIREIYAEEIRSRATATRESSDSSDQNFIRTKLNNLRDYTDACFRYLRATELTGISQIGHSIRIARGKEEDVRFILEHVDREPIHVDDVQAYKAYLFDAETPRLLTDDREALLAQLEPYGNYRGIDRSKVELKLELLLQRDRAKQRAIEEEIRQIKRYEQYDDIQSTFDGIVAAEFYDNPLMFEWNTWRAMTMIDGGVIQPNCKLDDDGQPVSTAIGNTADILCEYDDFDLIVEVTLQSGQKQYDNEGEPVARHLGKAKALSGKETFCLFVAPKVSPATIAYFYSLHLANIGHYGGKAVIVPMELQVFRKLLEDSKKVDYVPWPDQVKGIFEFSRGYALQASSEEDWYRKVTDYALHWLDPGALVV